MYYSARMLKHEKFKFFEARILVCGPARMGQKYIGACALDKLVREKIFVQSLDLPTLLSESSRVRLWGSLNFASPSRQDLSKLFKKSRDTVLQFCIYQTLIPGGPR